MTYGNRLFKNGKRRGYMHFSTGKTVVLKHTECIEFENKVQLWQFDAIDKYKFDRKGV